MQLKLDQKVIGKIAELANKYELQFLFLFGSQVTGETHKESDFDFGYISGRDLFIEEEGRLISELLYVSKAGDERLINLINFKKTTPLLLYSALNNAQLLYEREVNAFANYQAYAFKIYIETLPLFKLKAERLGIIVK